MMFELTQRVPQMKWSKGGPSPINPYPANVENMVSS
jgi:hypothetical protein